MLTIQLTDNESNQKIANNQTSKSSNKKPVKPDEMLVNWWQL
jgi:hypothetical protein